WVSRPLPRRRAKLALDQTLFLRELARKTWAYFETHIGPDDHWLPPDNVQEHPALNIAHRTSPTNIGLSLLANLTAHDFGYLSTGGLIERTTRAFDTMDQLDRYRGHFYNWYDTQSLKPLPPVYVSTVDSGNLNGHLITLRGGLLELPDRPILAPRVLDGIGDAIHVLEDALGTGAAARLTGLREALEAGCEASRRTIRAARECLERFAAAASETTPALEADAQVEPHARWWAG